MTETVLIVDDEEPIRDVVSSLLESRGYGCVTAGSAVEALSMLAENSGKYHLVISDIMMPEINGLTLLGKILERNRDIPVVMLSAVHDMQVALDAIRQGAWDYLVKPFEKEQLFLSVSRALERRRLIEDNRRYQLHLEKAVADRTRRLEDTLTQLERSYDFTLAALGSALDLKDSGTEGHSRRVTAFTVAIARSMGVANGMVRTIARGAYLHDIGKIGIPDAILNKAGPLTEDERAVMRTHCQRGWEILQRIPFLEEAAEIVLSHQEHFDGSGYPRGLKGDGIHVGARIFAVADAMDAMTSDRPYRAALPWSHAFGEIQAMAGTQFDPAVVQAAVSMPVETWKELRESARENFGLSAAGAS